LDNFSAIFIRKAMKMKNITRNQIIMLVIIVIAVGCMTHVSIKYNRAVKRLEQRTARTESLKNAYIRYLERKVNIIDCDSLTTTTDSQDLGE